MHADQIVLRFVQTHLDGMHASRRSVLAALALATMRGCSLTLSRLARGIHGAGLLKSAVNRVDRFIGHSRINQEAELLGAALTGLLQRMVPLLVVAVDWSAVSPAGRFVELRAAVTWPGMGRALTVCQEVHPIAKLGNPQIEQALLERLSRWIGRGTRVIVISDAGFRRPWYLQVEKYGWSFVGRLRGPVTFSCDGVAFAPATTWFDRARAKAMRWRDCILTKRFPFVMDVVAYRAPRIGRKPYRVRTHRAGGRAPQEARVCAREPWLLATSTNLRHYRPDEIVALYRQRMQIEECFRDNKSLAFGMGQEIARSRTPSRLRALLMIATLAAFLLWHIGQLAEAEGLHRRYKVTTRNEREISILRLGIFICLEMGPMPLSLIALTAMRRRLGI
jgi:hypothetical protein